MVMNSGGEGSVVGRKDPEGQFQMNGQEEGAPKDQRL
jgi:hypothetical protein